MDQNAVAAPSDDEQLAGAISQATEYILQGVGPMPPPLAIAGLLCAIERIACCGDQQFVMSVAQMVEDAASGLRSAGIAGGAPQIEVVR